MTDVKALQQERIKIYHDIYDNRIPKRVPVDINLTLNSKLYPPA